MDHATERPTLNDVLSEAATLTHDERRARILRCVTANGRHDPGTLPLCQDLSSQQVIHYCDRCWSV